MPQYWTILNLTLPVFLVILLGALVRRMGLLTMEADRTLMRLTIDVLFPCLAFESVLGNRALEQWNNLLLAPVLGVATLLLGYVVGKLLAPLSGLQGAVEKRTFAFAVGTYNYGYIPIPLTLALFDRETLGVLFLQNVAVEAGIWVFGLALLTGANPRQGWKQAFNMPLLAIGTGLIGNFLGLQTYVPDFAMTSLHMLGQCTIPVALLLIGATSLDHAGEIHGRGGGRTIVAGCFLRLALLPVLFLLMARWLPCSPELKRVIIIEAAMPSAVFPIVMAKHYGGDVPTALRVVLGTSLVSLITIPLWIYAGLAWIQP